jgi:hypothetical protein
MGSLGISSSVHIVGVVQRELLGAYYRLADVCVLPSLSETQSLVAQEAEAFELPVVVVDEGLVSGPKGLRFFAKPHPIPLALVIKECLASRLPREDIRYPSPEEYAPLARDQAKALLSTYVSALGCG